MDFFTIRIFLLLLSCLNSSSFSSSNDQAKILARAVKTLVEAVAEPSYLTVMSCWNSDFSFHFYSTFNDDNDTLLQSGHQLIITNLDFSKSPVLDNQYNEFILIDFGCEHGDEILLNSKQNLLKYFWIILDMESTEKSENHVWTTIEELSSISPKTEMFYMKKMQNSTISKFEIEQFYRVASSEPLITEQFGIILDDKLIDYRNQPITSQRRKNLFGLTLNASIVVTNNQTLNHLTDYREIQTDPLTKVNYMLTEFLMSYLNSSAEYSIVSTWGYKDDKTNEWSGMVGQLVRQEAELGASPLFMTVERVPIIQYIVSPTPTGSRFIFRSPKLSYTDNVFLLPFDSFVWYCLMVLVTITALFLIVSIYIERMFVASTNADGSDFRPTTVDLFFVIFGAVCQQGTHVTPKCTAARIIMVVAYTILMFLYTSYSANIVALLQSPSTKIKTLKDLYESRLEIGVDDTVFNRYYFSHAEEPMRKKIYLDKVLKKNGHENFMSLETGVEKVREGLFAFHMEVALGYKLMSETFHEDEKCGIVEIAYLQVTDPWYAIKKNSSYMEMFKIGLMRIDEHGLSNRENIRMYTRKPRCIGHAGNFVTASLVDTKPALMVLLWGYLITFVMIVVEFLAKYLQNKRQNRRMMSN